MVSCASMFLLQVSIIKIYLRFNLHSGAWRGRKQPEISLFRHLSPGIAPVERTDWKSHMAGDKPRAGIVCTLCRGSGTPPPHLKGSSGLAECFGGCMSSTAMFAYHRCHWFWSSLLVWTAVQSIQQLLSHQLGPVAASVEVQNFCSSLQWSVKAPASSG